MWIVIAGVVIASIVSSALLLSTLSVGRRGDEWVEATAPKKIKRFSKPATRVIPR